MQPKIYWTAGLQFSLQQFATDSVNSKCGLSLLKFLHENVNYKKKTTVKQQ